MTRSLHALTERIHHEPLTELALERYALTFDGTEWTLSATHQGAIQDLEFLVELSAFYQHPVEEQLGAFSGFDMPIVLDYLKRTHQFYKLRMLPKMELAIKSLKSTFPDHPICIVLDQFYSNYQNELLEHIDLEEMKLFPFAEQLNKGIIQEGFSVEEFRMHHDHRIEDHLEDMLIVIEDEFGEVYNSFAYRTFKNLLDNFRNDLAIHHLIEEKLFLSMVEDLERQTRND